MVAMAAALCHSSGVKSAVRADVDEARPVSIITGAAMGLGSGLAVGLAMAGWRVCLIDVVEDELEAITACQKPLKSSHLRCDKLGRTLALYRRISKPTVRLSGPATHLLDNGLGVVDRLAPAQEMTTLC